MVAVNSKGISASLNDELECISSASPGYKVGQVYKVICKDGIYGMVGSDGFFDPLTMICSGFHNLTQNPKKESKIKMVKY